MAESKDLEKENHQAFPDQHPRHKQPIEEYEFGILDIQNSFFF